MSETLLRTIGFDRAFANQSNKKIRDESREKSPEKSCTSPKYGYFVNLNERGHFYADVRGQDGKTVFEVKSGNSLERDEMDLIEMGYMKHGTDISGLSEYLKSLGLIPVDAELMNSKEFEEL